MFVLSVPVFIILAYFYTKSLERVYRYKSSVLMSQQRTGAKRIDNLLDIVDIESKVNPNDEIGVITSYSMIEKTIKELDFGVSYFQVTDYGKNEKYGTRFPFKVTVDSSSIQMTGVPIYVNILSEKAYELIVEDEDIYLYDLQKDEMLPRKLGKAKIRKKVKFGEWFKSDHLTIKIDLQDSPKLFGGDKLYFVINNMNALVKQHQRGLKVEPAARDSYLFEIRMEGVNTLKRVTFMNKLMEVVVQENLNVKNKEGLRALSFIEEQLKDAQDSLYRAEINYKAYQAEKGLMDIKNQSMVATQNLDELYKSKTDIELKLSSYQAILNDISGNSTMSVAPASYNVTDANITSYLNTLNQLHLSAAEFQNLAPSNPTVIQNKEKIITTTNSLKSYLGQNIQVTRNTLLRINSRIGDAKGVRTTLPIDDKRLNELSRKFEYYKRTYEDLLDKRFDARIGLETNVSDIRIVELAKKEKDAPVKPNTKLFFMLALIFGAGLPLGYIVLMDIINNTVQNKKDIKDITNIPFLGMIADGGAKNKLLGLDRPKSLAAESFRSLRINVDNVFEDSNKSQIVGITSTIEKEGKTYCSVNLSLNYALNGKKTILVGTDLFKNQLVDYFDSLRENNGLSAYLKGETDLESIIQGTKVEKLHVITCGDIPSNPSQLINSDRMKTLLEELSYHYDRIILDIPPIAYVSDYYTLRNYLGATLYIVKYNYSDKKYLDEINEQFDNKRVDNIYIVLNHVRFSSMYGI